MVGTLLCLVMLWLGAGWQRDIHELMGQDAPAGYTSVGIVVLSVLVFALFVGIGRGIRWLAARLVRLFGRLLPRRVARPLGVVVVTALVIFLLNGVLFQGLVDAMNSAFSVKDDGTEEGAVEPTASERSGSPASLVPWDGPRPAGARLRREGADARELEAFSGRPAKEPVRAYVGLASAEDVGDRAALAVRDLERAGGFDRSVLVVVTTTGTGWVDPAAATRSSTSSTATPRWSRCSTPTCPAGCPSWSTRSRRATPAARCSTRSTARGRSCRPTRARSSSCSGRASAPSAARPPSAGSPTSRTARTASCGPGRPTSTRSRARSWTTGTPGRRSGCRSSTAAAPCASPTRPRTWPSRRPLG